MKSESRRQERACPRHEFTGPPEGQETRARRTEPVQPPLCTTPDATMTRRPDTSTRRRRSHTGPWPRRTRVSPRFYHGNTEELGQYRALTRGMCLTGPCGPFCSLTASVKPATPSCRRKSALDVCSAFEPYSATAHCCSLSQAFAVLLVLWSSAPDFVVK